MRPVSPDVLAGCYVKGATEIKQGKIAARGFYRKKQNRSKALKTPGKIYVENSVESVDNSLHSRFQKGIYVKSDSEDFGGMHSEKKPEIRAFFHAYAVENRRMRMHCAAVILPVIAGEKKSIDARRKLWYHVSA